MKKTGATVPVFSWELGSLLCGQVVGLANEAEADEGGVFVPPFGGGATRVGFIPDSRVGEIQPIARQILRFGEVMSTTHHAEAGIKATVGHPFGHVAQHVIESNFVSSALGHAPMTLSEGGFGFE